MSKHNNNLSSCLDRKCYCGRYMSIGEAKAGIGVFSYTCPDCLKRQNEKRWIEMKHTTLKKVENM